MFNSILPTTGEPSSAQQDEQWTEALPRERHPFLVVTEHTPWRDMRPAPPGWVAIRVDGSGNEVPGEAYPIVGWATADRARTPVWFQERPLPTALWSHYHERTENVPVTIVAGPSGLEVAEDLTLGGRLVFEGNVMRVELKAAAVHVVTYEYAGVVR